MQKFSFILLLGFSILACTQTKFQSGTYSAETMSSDPIRLPTVDLNVTGDQIIDGQWKSSQNPKLGKIESAPNFLKGRTFSIFLPECKKDLPISLEQLGKDLKVQIDPLPACDILRQTYILHLEK